MPSAEFIQGLTAKTRADYGGRLTVGSKTYPMTTRSLENSEREFLPDDAQNAADADLRVFLVTATDFPVWPALGIEIVWGDQTFTLIAVRPGDDVIGATLMKLRLIAYKSPGESGANTTETEEQQDQNNIWEGRRLNA